MLRDLGKTIGPRAPGGPDGLVPANRFGLVLGKWRGGPCEAPIRGRGAENNKKQDLTLNAQSPELGEVIEFPAVHGLHHYYLRQAA